MRFFVDTAGKSQVQLLSYSCTKTKECLQKKKKKKKTLKITAGKNFGHCCSFCSFITTVFFFIVHVQNTIMMIISSASPLSKFLELKLVTEVSFNIVNCKK